MNKKILAASGAVLAAFALIAAAPAPAQEEPVREVYNEKLGMLVAASPGWPEPIPRGIADANNAFAADFYRQVSDSDQNIFFSPASIYTAFSLLYEGAGGQTASQMQDTFGFEAGTPTRHDDTARLMAALNYDDGYTTLGMANALWLADWFEPYEDYLDTARGAYLADAQKVDFEDPGDAVRRINDWAAEKTNGKIGRAVTEEAVSGATAMMLTNAIHFDGEWVRTFPEENTRTARFWTDGDTAVEADFMHVNNMFYYAESDGAQVLRMHYMGDRFAMLAVLPAERDGLAALERGITGERLEEWMSGMYPHEVNIAMPKFEMETDYDLKEILGSLGMTEVFGPAADLGGIAAGDLFVDEALQKAYVRVNENGTEAAAVTINWMLQYSGTLRADFVADHPFLFMIYDVESGMVLFMGRVVDPTA